MVKVKKPTPKTLSNASNQEKTIKTSNLNKVQKPKKAVSEEKVLPKVAKKAKLSEKTVQAAFKEVVIKKKGQEPLPKKTNKKEKQQKDVKKTAATAKPRPLVLAPPESPKPQPPAKNEKQQQKFPVAKKNKKAKKTIKDGAQKPQQQQKTPLSKMQKKKATKRAFKKQQIKNKKAGKNLKQKVARPSNFEPLPFDEDKFNAIVNTANIKKIAKGLKTLTEKEVAEKKTSIFSDFQYILNIASFKIPNCPKRMVKLNLKHSLVDKDDDVVIVVPDLQRGSKVDYEPTIQHYEDLFREAGIEGLKIMPFNQLRTECNTFEAVRKFGNTYDYFLCDGRLVGQVAGFCGKIFQKPRTTFHAVRMENTKNLKNEIEKSLRRTAYKQLQKGDLISIPVGNHKHTAQRLTENVEHVVEQLKTLYPGGLGNIRSIHLKINIVGTSSLPIYVSCGQVPPETPYVIGPRELHMLKVKRDANEVLAKFSINKDGDIKKLNKTQVERKRKLKEAHAALLPENGDKNTEEKPTDDDGDDVVVPTKKSRNEELPEVVEEAKRIDVEREVDEDDDGADIEEASSDEAENEEEEAESEADVVDEDENNEISDDEDVDEDTDDNEEDEEKDDDVEDEDDSSSD